MSKTALITGVAGQDGSYLAEFLLARQYRVHGVVRPGGTPARERLGELVDRLQVHELDLAADDDRLAELLRAVQPDEIYHLASPTFVPDSWRRPAETAQAAALSTARLLGAVGEVDARIRFFLAGSSAVFGSPRESPQSESTPLSPRTPYGAAKAYAQHLTAAYRESKGLFACCGILFNHESPRRGGEFVSRKITQAAARIRRGDATPLRLGNLDAARDWGFAGDYVDAMWRMLQQDAPRDLVIGTGRSHTVRDFAAAAFAHAGLDWREHVVCDAELFRPAENVPLAADIRAARQFLGWEPQTPFEDLVRMMVDADLALTATSP